MSSLSSSGEIGQVDGQPGDNLKGITLTGHKGLVGIAYLMYGRTSLAMKIAEYTSLKTAYK